MEKYRNRILLALTFIGLFLLARPLAREFARQRDYMQAEQLHHPVWFLSTQMKQFAHDRGRSPESFEELRQFAPEHDLSELQGYPYQFRQRGPLRFVLWANARYALTINDQFEIVWTSPDAVEGSPAP